MSCRNTCTTHELAHTTRMHLGQLGLTLPQNHPPLPSLHTMRERQRKKHTIRLRFNSSIPRPPPLLFPISPFLFLFTSRFSVFYGMLLARRRTANRIFLFSFFSFAFSFFFFSFSLLFCIYSFCCEKKKVFCNFESLCGDGSGER